MVREGFPEAFEWEKRDVPTARAVGNPAPASPEYERTGERRRGEAAKDRPGSPDCESNRESRSAPPRNPRNPQRN